MKRLTRARAFFAILVFAAILLAVGCSKPAEPTTPSTPSTPSTPAPTIKKDGSLIIANPTELITFDPQATTALQTQRIREQVYDSLVDVDWEMNIVGSLAKEWTMADDGLTYTFKLRDDVTFHSGKKMDSSDVKFTFERWLDTTRTSPNRLLLNGVSEIQTPDPYTVVLKMSKINMDLLYNLAKSDASILNAKVTAEAGADFGTKVVDGTGPFKLKEWTPRVRIVLERFDDYKWAPENYENRGPAHIKEIVYKMLPDESARLLELETGGVHIIQPRISFHEVDLLKQQGRHQLIEYAPGSTVNVAFNLSMPPMDDINIRKAFSHAVNTKELIDKVMFGHAYPAEGLVAPSIPGACPECKDLQAKHDPALAKQILEEAGWGLGSDGIRVKDGVRLEIPAHFFGTLAPYPDAYQVIQAQVRAVGIHLELNGWESAQVFALFNKGENGVWSSSIPHDTAFQALNARLHSKSAPSPNRANFKNSQVDQLIEQASVTADATERNRMYREVQKIALQNYVYVPWFHDKSIMAIRKEVKGFRPYVLANSGFHKMTDVWIDK